MKRVILVHGWGGNPKEPWFVWIKKELEKRNFKVIIPKMPNSDYPKIKLWVNHLKKVIKNPDENTYLIGHSIGCQTVLRYLEKINKKIGGCILVAGFFDLKNLETVEVKKIAKPWLKNDINFNKIKRNTKKFVAIFSDNDPFVSLDNAKTFRNKLNAKIIIEHNQGHFDPSSNVRKLPSALKSLLQISK